MTPPTPSQDPLRNPNVAWLAAPDGASSLLVSGENYSVVRDALLAALALAKRQPGPVYFCAPEVMGERVLTLDSRTIERVLLDQFSEAVLEVEALTFLKEDGGGLAFKPDAKSFFRGAMAMEYAIHFANLYRRPVTLIAREEETGLEIHARIAPGHRLLEAEGLYILAREEAYRRRAQSRLDRLEALYNEDLKDALAGAAKGHGALLLVQWVEDFSAAFEGDAAVADHVNRLGIAPELLRAFARAGFVPRQSLEDPQAWRAMGARDFAKAVCGAFLHYVMHEEGFVALARDGEALSKQQDPRLPVAALNLIGEGGFRGAAERYRLLAQREIVKRDSAGRE